MERTQMLLPAPAEYEEVRMLDEEMQATLDIVNEGGLDFSPVESGDAISPDLDSPKTDYQPGDEIKGEIFDAVRHKTHPNGQPVLGSKNQLLLKKEFKKSAKQKITDSVKNFFSHKEEVEEEISEPEIAQEEIQEKRVFPPNDDELQEEKAVEEERVVETSRQERKKRKSAEKTANGIILGAGLVVGPEIHRQKKSEEYGDLVDACEEWEGETGHKFDLHPNLAFPVAVFASISAMAKNEPQCKSRMDAAAVMIRQNVLGALGEKFPVLKVILGEGSPVPVAVDSEHEQEAS